MQNKNSDIVICLPMILIGLGANVNEESAYRPYYDPKFPGKLQAIENSELLDLLKDTKFVSLYRKFFVRIMKFEEFVKSQIPLV